jgi:hypothetical protein
VLSKAVVSADVKFLSPLTENYWPIPVAVRPKVLLLGSRVRIQLRARMFVSCVCCVLCR